MAADASTSAYKINFVAPETTVGGKQNLFQLLIKHIILFTEAIGYSCLPPLKSSHCYCKGFQLYIYMHCQCYRHLLELQVCSHNKKIVLISLPHVL